MRTASLSACNGHRDCMLRIVGRLTGYGEAMCLQRCRYGDPEKLIALHACWGPAQSVAMADNTAVAGSVSQSAPNNPSVIALMQMEAGSLYGLKYFETQEHAKSKFMATLQPLLDGRRAADQAWPQSRDMNYNSSFDPPTAVLRVSTLVDGLLIVEEADQCYDKYMTFILLGVTKESILLALSQFQDGDIDVPASVRDPS
jgi:hypothetical protein